MEIRPTSDRAREALFSILGQKVINSQVLDLFAGTGALGLEALSRGANRACFVDYHRLSLELLAKNIRGCNFGPDRATILRHDLRKGAPPQLQSTSTDITFNLIFLDPPYGKNLAVKSLKWLSNSLIFAANAVIIAEERASVALPARCGILHLKDQRTYGDTGFWLYSPYRTDYPASETT